jgi:hypothetical protein
MASELIDHFALRPKVAKPGGALPEPDCAGCGRRIRRPPRGRARGTLAEFHQRCPIASAPSREGSAITIFCAAVVAGRRAPANRIEQLIESGGIA